MPVAFALVAVHCGAMSALILYGVAWLAATTPNNWVLAATAVVGAAVGATIFSGMVLAAQIDVDISKEFNALPDMRADAEWRELEDEYLCRRTRHRAQAASRAHQYRNNGISP